MIAIGLSQAGKTLLFAKLSAETVAGDLKPTVGEYSVHALLREMSQLIKEYPATFVHFSTGYSVCAKLLASDHSGQ